MSRVLLAILVCGLLMIPVSVFLMQEPRTAMITMTMDDGSQSLYDIAFTIFKEHGIPGTIDVTNQVINGLNNKIQVGIFRIISTIF